MKYFEIDFEPQVSRHNKLCSVGKRNTVVRLLCQRLRQATRHSLDGKSKVLPETTILKILLKVRHFTNILYGNNIVSSLKTAGGYTSAIVKLFKTFLNESLIKVRNKKEFKRKM